MSMVAKAVAPANAAPIGCPLRTASTTTSTSVGSTSSKQTCASRQPVTARAVRHSASKNADVPAVRSTHPCRRRRHRRS